MTRTLLAFALPLLLVAGCGGSDQPTTPKEVVMFNSARESLLSSDSAGYSWTVNIKAFPKPLVHKDVCWDGGSVRPPALEALASAEAYGAHRGDSSEVDIDIPALEALKLLGVKAAELKDSVLTEEDVAPAVAALSGGTITQLTVDGQALARQLDNDDVPLDSQLRAHAELATAVVVLTPGATSC